jgi:hypothetical protein
MVQRSSGDMLQVVLGRWPWPFNFLAALGNDKSASLCLHGVAVVLPPPRPSEQVTLNTHDSMLTMDQMFQFSKSLILGTQTPVDDISNNRVYVCVTLYKHIQARFRQQPFCREATDSQSYVLCVFPCHAAHVSHSEGLFAPWSHAASVIVQICEIRRGPLGSY